MFFRRLWAYLLRLCGCPYAYDNFMRLGRRSRYLDAWYIPGKDADEVLVSDVCTVPLSLVQSSVSWEDKARRLYGREYVYRDYDWMFFSDVGALISDLDRSFGDHPVRRRMALEKSGDMYVEVEDIVKYVFDNRSSGNTIVLGVDNVQLSFLVGDRIACEVDVGDRLCVRGHVQSWSKDTVRIDVFDIFQFFGEKEEKECEKESKNT